MLNSSLGNDIIIKKLILDLYPIADGNRPSYKNADHLNVQVLLGC